VNIVSAASLSMSTGFGAFGAAAALCAGLAEFSGTSTLVATHLSDPADGERSMRTIRRLFGGDAILAYPGLEIPLVPREKELPEPF